ncbi:hypothetical protein B0H11DRAFT_2027386 [Mycena galericulata]|nr:hypothetical protein B0H11DRAFT_2027386 [Mycena galericulata]
MAHSSELLPVDILRRKVKIDLSLPRSNGAFDQAVANAYINPTFELLKQPACTPRKVEIDIVLCPNPDCVRLDLKEFPLFNRLDPTAYITVYDVLRAISDWCRAPASHVERLPDDLRKAARKSATKRKARFPADDENLKQCDLLRGYTCFVGSIEIVNQQRPGGRGIDLWKIYLESNTDQADV